MCALRSTESPPVSIRRHAVLCAILALFVLAVFGQVVTFDFVGYDDPETITENPFVLQGVNLESIHWAFTSFQYFANWFPITWFTHMVDVELYGVAPGGHHLTSVLLHLLNVLLLYGVLFGMTRAPWRSAIVAGLFAVHPLHVETVAWVSERKGVLSTTFWLLAMGAYLRYARGPSIARYGAVAGLLVAGLLSKPMLVTLPFVLLLLDYWPLERMRLEGEDWRRNVGRLVAEKIPLLIGVALMSFIALGTQVRGGALKSADAYPLTIRLGNAVVSYVTYIEKTFVPRDLAVLYPHPGDSLALGQVVLCGLVLVVVSVAAVVLARRAPYVFVGWFWFVGTLVPVSQIVQLGGHGMADRYVYVPHIGLFVALVWGIAALFARYRVPARAGVAIAAIVLVMFAGLAYRQAGFWRDSFALYRHALAVTTDNRIVHNNLGRSLMDLGEVEEAMEHYREALRIAPDYVTAHVNYGNALVGQRDLAGAAQHFERATRIDPAYAPAFNNLGNAYMGLGRHEDAIAQFERAIELNPDAAATYNNLGAAYYQLGDYEAAAEQFRAALTRDPNYAKAARNLAATEAKRTQ